MLHKDAQCFLLSSILILLKYLTIEEETQIHQQFLGSEWRPNSQVLWSGVQREEAQTWADAHNMQTLTTAMGPLMDPENSLCLKPKKSKLGWSRYIKGASAVFAWCISKGEKVTVLTPPPPERFHPSGYTNYQSIEEPILKWAAKSRTLRIEMVHPVVQGAGDFSYQIWPVDETATWAAVFEIETQKTYHWRRVKVEPPQISIRKCIKTKEEDYVRHVPDHWNKRAKAI